MNDHESTSTRLPYIDDLVSWLGIAWLVAFLAGMWGAMIGIGKFGTSEFLFLLCGAIVLGKVGYETTREGTNRRIIAFVLCLFLITAVEFLVMHWTNGLAEEVTEQQQRLKKLDDIPGLNNQLQALRQQETIDRAKAEQQVADIGETNNQLKASIEKKDAALISIAKAQYDLNFVPSIDLLFQDGQLHVWNMGARNIYVWGEKYEGTPPSLESSGRAISPKGNYFLQVGILPQTVFAKIGANGEVDVAFELYISSEDGGCPIPS